MKDKKESIIIRFLNSYKSICAVLGALSLFLIIYNFYFVKSVNLYVFNGFSDKMTFLDGSIYTGFDVNHLSSPIIIYTADETVLKDYKIGYYIGDNPISIIESKDTADKEIKLSEFLKNNEFSFTEAHKDAMFFSKENIKKIDKLSFKVTGTDQNNEKITIELPLSVEKVSK